MNIDIEMMRRYDKPGPRYTSYPTAPRFSVDFGADAFGKAIVKSNLAAAPTDLSLYLHFPFCDTLCYFCGCTMLVTRNRERIDAYLGYLIKEIKLVSQLIKPGRKVAQMHWGGGTPTYLEPEQIRRIFGAINAHFEFHDDAEIGVEIDPRGMTDAHLDALQDVGFNRASMGVQDFDPKVQQAINRLQPEELTRWAFDGLRDRDFRSINLDLIYGLPFQTAGSFAHTLERIIDISPERLAVFNYAHVPWMKKHQRIIREETLPSADAKLNILKSTIEKLTASGYVYIGMDHFAKPEDDLTQAYYKKQLYRNFQGYSTKAGCDLYAMGMSSISQLHEVYAQNVKELPAYYAALDAGRLPTERGYCLSPDDQIRRHVITRLMCDFELCKKEIEHTFAIDFNAYFESALQQLEPLLLDGLVKFEDDKIKATEMGHLLIRNIAMAFDAHLTTMKSESTTPMFSKTV